VEEFEAVVAREMEISDEFNTERAQRKNTETVENRKKAEVPDRKTPPLRQTAKGGAAANTVGWAQQGTVSSGRSGARPMVNCENRVETLW